jgi:predicted nucleotidyltransferase
MLVCGTITEYNPFHHGHSFQLSETRRRLGEEIPCVAVMSGCFVQRGQPAYFPPSVRAEMAVKSGADLVVELPLTAALSSAEGFARGGIAVLQALGFVTHFSFGSELGEIQPFLEMARILTRPDFSQKIADQLICGISYAAARQKALAAENPALASLLSAPNNILGAEYCKALLGTNIQPLTIPRRGAVHDSQTPAPPFASASYLRQLLRKDPAACRPFLPPEAYVVLQKAWNAGCRPYDPEKLELLLLAAGRRLTVSQLAQLPDAAEGLENRLHEALYHSTSLAECLARAKSKRYPESRIRRMLMCALLGITQEDTRLPLSYIRVLAFNERGRQLLRLAKDTCTVPLLIRPTQGKALTGDAARLFGLDVYAHDIFSLIGSAPQPGGGFFRQSPGYFPLSAP